jgi:hypothetical protein
LIHGIEGRKRQINCPGWVGLLRWLKPLLATPNVAGPFKLESLQEGKITYTRFDDYWDVENTGIAAGMDPAERQGIRAQIVELNAVSPISSYAACISRRSCSASSSRPSRRSISAMI